MTIEDKDNNSTWVEVKEISCLSYPQKSHDYFTISFYDWDNKEYITNFDPYEFLNWVDNKTLKELKKHIIKELNTKTK
tara:strand:- start:156 stop:389 length:234 start_codon:yes stop_codon:yes gene_type:complete